MKITFKSIFAVAKRLFSKLASVISPANYFTGELVSKAWEIYNDFKASYIKKGVWVGSLRKGLFSDSIRIAKQVLSFEKMGVVQFKKVDDNETIYSRNILLGLLDFKAVGQGLYRFIDEFVLEANGGDIKGAIRSFKLERIHFSR